MGVSGFYKWLHEAGYQPCKVILSLDDTFIVDAKLMMNKIAYGIHSDCENLPLEIANRIYSDFKDYKDVLFVNDGNTQIPFLKLNTLQERTKCKKQVQSKVEEQELKLHTLKRKFQEEQSVPNNIESNMTEMDILKEKLEVTKRQARRITTEISKEVLRCLQMKGFKTLQCKGEADPILIQLSSKFTYLVSEDGDLLVGGANNLLRSFQKENLYYSNIYEKINLTTLQLKEMACMGGCDYTKGLKGIGLKNAEKFIRKYSSLEGFLKSKDGANHPMEFLNIAKEAIDLFCPNLIISEVCECFPINLTF